MKFSCAENLHNAYIKRLRILFVLVGLRKINELEKCRLSSLGDKEIFWILKLLKQNLGSFFGQIKNKS